MITHQKINSCPYEVNKTRFQLMKILKSLVPDKQLGMIEKKKYLPEKAWLKTVIYSLDPNHDIFKKKQIKFKDEIERTVPAK